MSWIVPLIFLHFTSALLILTSYTLQRLSYKKSPDRPAQFLHVAWTRFANLGSLCQNSTHKQIRHNTGKYTINIYVKLKLCYRNLKILCQNVTSGQNDEHLYHTLSDQQQHTSLVYINHCSLSYPLLLFSSTEGTFSEKSKNQMLNTVHRSTVLYSAVNSD